MQNRPTSVFVNNLRQSRILSEGQIAELLRLPQCKDEAAIGRELTRRSWLTPFQVQVIQCGNQAELTVGQYCITERLGSGGMGHVYRAMQNSTQRVVALKIIRRSKRSNPVAAKRFYQEARVVGQLNHPNIVAAYDAGQAGDTHYLAMEFVDGTDLSRLVKKQGALRVGQACGYVRQAALGLQHAHERGLVHRDIKPANLLLTRSDNTIKLLDLGLARVTDSMDGPEEALTRVGAVVGTPKYLAPEQAVNSSTVDIRSDIYSLGCTLYFLLTGFAPFRGKDLPEVLLKHQTEKAAPLATYRGDVPASVQELVNKMMAKRPADRLQTPAEVAAALAPMANDSSKEKKKKKRKSKGVIVAAAKGRRPKRSLPALAGTAVLVLALVGLAAIVAGAVFSDGPGLAKATASTRPVTEPSPKPEGTEQTKKATPTKLLVPPKPDPEPRPGPKQTKPEPKPTEPEPTKPKPTKPEQTKPKPKPKPPKPPKPKPPKPAPPKPNMPEKEPAPPAGVLAKATANLRRQYARQYRRTNPVELAAFAEKLFDRAVAAKDSTLRFALLQETAGVAMRAGDFEKLLAAVDQLDKKFAVDALGLKTAAMEQAAQLPQNQSYMLTLTHAALRLLDEAVLHDNFDIANRLHGVAQKTAQASNNAVMIKRVSARSAEILQIAKRFNTVKDAGQALENNPDDTRSMKLWGGYQSFYKGDWGTGLPLLARAGEPKIKSTAQQDMSTPENPERQVLVGDAWWDLAQEKQSVVKRNIYARARHWYRQAADQLDKTERTRIKNRLAGMVEEFPTLADLSGGDSDQSPAEKAYKQSMAQGRNHFRLGQFERAVRAFSQALRVKPGDPDAAGALQLARNAAKIGRNR